MNADSKCSNCRYWLSYEDTDNGECHRYPPEIGKAQGWVRTHKDDFCGEHKIASILRKGGKDPVFVAKAH